MSHINYETDTPKHYVRTDGWLKAAKEQKNVVRRRSKNIPLRYFTFCAAKAIDVFMLEREGILNRSAKTGRLEGVYFCEKNDEDFGEIAELIGPTEEGFRGEFEKIVLFEDDEDTEGKSLLDEDENLHPDHIHKKLQIKDAHDRLHKAFPFDIINLDVCGVMFPLKKGVIPPLLKSILHILRWQTESKFSNTHKCDRFTLFLTSPINRDSTNQTAIQQLEDLVRKNINTIADFQAAFAQRYGHDDVHQLVHENFARFFCVALPKFIIDLALRQFGWRVTCGPTYLYNRDDRWVENKQYQIMHTVSVYERILKRPDMRSEDQYIQAVTQLVNNPVKWVDKILTPERKQELEEDLKQIINFRNSRST